MEEQKEDLILSQPSETEPENEKKQGKDILPTNEPLKKIEDLTRVIFSTDFIKKRR